MISIIGLVIIGCLLTAWFLWPLIENFSTGLTSYSDGQLIGWIIDWVSRAVLSGENVYHAPFLWPYQNTLAYAQLFISTGLINIPLKLLNFSIVEQLNFHFLTGTLIMFMGMSWLAKKITGDWLAGIFAGSIFAFSIFHLSFVVHLHAYLLGGLPIIALGLWELIEESSKNKKYLISPVWKICLGFVYQALNDPHTGMFGAAIIFTTLVISKNRSIAKQLIWPVVFSLITVVLFYLPYLQVSNQFEYVRSIRDAAHFSYSINDFFNLESAFYISLLIGLVLLSNRSKQWPNNQKTWLIISLILFIVGAVLMFGPVVKINGQTLKIFNLPIPLPYAVFYYLVPGFQAIRSATRWLLLANFGLALVAAGLFGRSRLTKFGKITVLMLTIASMYYQNKALIKTYATPTQAPDIYQDLADFQDSNLAEMPFLHWAMAPYTDWEADRLNYQSKHHITLLNGITGFTPPERLDLIEELWKSFPSRESVDLLKSQGAELILVHLDEYRQLNDDDYSYNNHKAPTEIEIFKQLNSFQNLTLLKCVNEKCLYIIN